MSSPSSPETAPRGHEYSGLTGVFMSVTGMIINAISAAEQWRRGASRREPSMTQRWRDNTEAHLTSVRSQLAEDRRLARAALTQSLHEG